MITSKKTAPKTKSVALALILGIFFGPLAIFYTNAIIAVLLCLLAAVVFIAGRWFGLAIFWPVCALVSWAIAYFESKARKQGE
jgi:hypothetical protein